MDRYTEAQFNQIGNLLYQCERCFIYEFMDDGVSFETVLKLLEKQNKEHGRPVKIFHIHGKGRGILAGKEYFIYDWNTHIDEWNEHVEKYG